MKDNNTERIYTTSKGELEERQREENKYKELLQHRETFEKLTYSEKLKFWDKHKLNFKNYMFPGYDIEPEIASKPDYKLPDIYQFKINPSDKNSEEIFTYVEWYSEHLKKHSPLEYDFDEMKKDFFDKTKDQFIHIAIEYTETLLNRFINERKELESKHRAYLLINFDEGYSAIRDKKEIRPFKFMMRDVECLNKGKINALMKGFLSEQLQILKDKPIQANNINDIVDIDNDILQVRTKIILFHELGIIDYLIERSNTFKNSQTELAKFITELIETHESNKEKTFEAVRTDLRYIKTPKNSIPKGKNPKNETAIKKVNSILSKYGLPNIGQ